MAKEANTKFPYAGNHIIKLWEQYLKAIDRDIKFYSTGEVVDSIFINGLQQTKEAVIVLNNDNTPYLNKDHKTLTLCGEVDYKGDDAKNKIEEAIIQITNYNSIQDNEIKITNHLIILPYRPSFFHWSLATIELAIEENKITSASISVYDPMGGRSGVRNGIKETLSIIFGLQGDKLLENIFNHPKQQDDNTSCGAISAENGKVFLSNNGTAPSTLLSKAYLPGARELRERHIEEINDDIFYDEQSKNIIHEAKGDKPIENQGSIKELLQSLIQKPENDWLKQVILKIKTIHDDIYASAIDTQLKNSHLELVKEFLIQVSVSGEIKDSVLNSIFKSNRQYQDGAMELILSLTDNFRPFQPNTPSKGQEASTKPAARTRTPEVTREEDLKKISKAQGIIQDTLTHLDALSAQSLLQNLNEISSSLKLIAWSRLDATCIRNIHGYRTHKDGSNDKNAVGAKLNFDVLSKLGELSEDVTLKNLLIANKDLLRSGLESLKGKIQIIISNSILEDIKKMPADNTQTQIGFLENVSAFYNDYSDIISLINLCEESRLYFQTISDEELMSSQVEKYYLGRLFVKIGETAKSISDYIKPQASKNNGANDIIRAFFGALKDYRDTVKGTPEILYSKTSIKLLQTKLFFEEVMWYLMSRQIFQYLEV